MHAHYYGTLLCSALTALGAAPGQEKSETTGTPSKPDPNAVEVRFADDSTVKMSLQHASIEVATRYGKLTVPAADIRHIEFGMRIPEETTKRIDAALALLGSRDFKQREAAGAELLSLRELAYPALQQAARSNDMEVARRAKDAIKVLVETVPAEKLHLKRHDTVVAADFTIIGQIEAPVLKARTPYFGETTLKLAEVRSMRWIANERESKAVVDAGRYGGPQEAWLDTGIEVRALTNLQIAASGTVDLRPAAGEAGTAVVSPDGLQSARTAGGRGAFGPGGGGPARGFGRPTASTQSPGTLIGRIGEFGKVFIVGSRYEGPAGEEGKLYLRIVASPYDSQSSGSYEVKVVTGR